MFLKTIPSLYWAHLISIIYNRSLCCHIHLELHVWLELGRTKSLSTFWVLSEAELLDVQTISQISRDVFSQWYQISTIKCTGEFKENKFKNLSGPLKQNKTKRLTSTDKNHTWRTSSSERETERDRKRERSIVNVSFITSPIAENNFPATAETRMGYL